MPIVRLSIVVMHDGQLYCARTTDALNAPNRDKRYGSIELPDYECAKFLPILFGPDARPFNASEIMLIQNMALPLFTDQSEGHNFYE